MDSHLKYAGLTPDDQKAALQEIIISDTLLMQLLHGMDELNLPDGLLVSGIIYNTVWNVLTGRPRRYGVKDADIAYFDSADRSYEAENRMITDVRAHFPNIAVPLELRNQARVHLWFPEKFGMPYPELSCGADMLSYFATRTHAVAARLQGGDIVIHAPFGLDDLFSFRLTPNPVLPNRKTHEAKSSRACAIWPELSQVPWPDVTD